MDKLRHAMETAIEQRWHAPLHHGSAPESPEPVPVARRDNSPRSITVPAETFARHRVVAALPDSIERDAYCLLQAAVSERVRKVRDPVIGVTGPGRGTGKTLTAVNLAVSLAVDARRPTILIDLDLHAPAVHRLFGAEIKHGVEHCVFDKTLIHKALFSPGISRLAVLPARGGSRSATQILRSAELGVMLDTIRKAYPNRILVADLPSATEARDVGAIEALVDGIVLVVRAGVTRERAYQRALQSFDRKKLLGTVLNAASRR